MPPDRSISIPDEGRTSAMDAFMRHPGVGHPKNPLGLARALDAALEAVAPALFEAWAESLLSDEAVERVRARLEEMAESTDREVAKALEGDGWELHIAKACIRAALGLSDTGESD